jgi:N-acetylglucosamine repressor
MKVRKATHSELKRHNRQSLLRAVIYGLADNRAALAQVTGLAKPTVSDLISELIDEGLLEEGGHGEANEQGGKRPRLLNFLPDARQVIGITISSHRVTGVLSNLAGQVIAEHYALLDSATGDAVITLLKEVLNGLVAQLDAPLLCIGVGVPGVVNSSAGVIDYAARLGWRNLPLADHLRAIYECPVYIGNNSELAALAQFAFSNPDMTGEQNLVTILVNNTVEIGVVVQGAMYHHGGDIGTLRIAAAGGTQTLDDSLSWDCVQQRIQALREQYPETLLRTGDLTPIEVRYAAAQGDPLALALYDELAGYLAEITAWAIALLRPQHVSLVGEIIDLGEMLLDPLRRKAGERLSPEQVAAVALSLVNGVNLSALGAVAQAVQHELHIL